MKNKDNFHISTAVFLFVVVMALSLSIGCAGNPDDGTTTTSSSSSTTSSTSTSTTTTTICNAQKETKCQGSTDPTPDCCKNGEENCAHITATHYECAAGDCITGYTKCGNHCIKDGVEGCCTYGDPAQQSPYNLKAECCDALDASGHTGTGPHPNGHKDCPGVTPTTAPTLKCSGAPPCQANCYVSGNTCGSCCGADTGNPNPSECNGKAYVECPTSTVDESHCVWDFAGLHFSQCPSG